MRYTPQGAAVVNFSVATNRSWKDASGETKEEATFHRVVVWSKLAELCAQLLNKGKKVYIEGRLSNRSWKDQEGKEHFVTEIVADEMLVLDRRRDVEPTISQPPEPELEPAPVKKRVSKKGGEK